MPERIARPRAPARVELTLAQQAGVVAQLAQQLGAGLAAGAIERIETHISFVLLAGAFAYKIKKAVNLGSSISRRLRAGAISGKWNCAKIEGSHPRSTSVWFPSRGTATAPNSAVTAPSSTVR